MRDPFAEAKAGRKKNGTNNARRMPQHDPLGNGAIMCPGVGFCRPYGSAECLELHATVLVRVRIGVFKKEAFA